MDLNRFQQQLKGTSDAARPLPPVDKWDPPFCGDINLTIALDGRWFYEGSPIGRISLVRLFASVLKREGDNYYLVTPVEKVGIKVEDTPFLITEWHKKDDTLVLVTQTGDEIPLTSSAQLELRTPPPAISDDKATPIPYICVRRNLWARLHQNTYYQLLSHANEAHTQQAEGGDITRFTIRSGQQEFVIGEVAD
ncbi:DUF1285 domain-containing protein [Alteromonas sp. 345S023]|jgi:hypothetical protein|uniref:DUF1285 domain-containing protein n=1 Tax=Alteromonas profundi TaxID=2696062 RepID=A0A7X5LK42_9ALTE|nr:DUF1285 domain-containing protein [Alteromonas profundi]NDV90832.1 DUF1285 domain-containing protein [Alteromonas profundi]